MTYTEGDTTHSHTHTHTEACTLSVRHTTTRHEACVSSGVCDRKHVNIPVNIHCCKLYTCGKARKGAHNQSECVLKSIVCVSIQLLSVLQVYACIRNEYQEGSSADLLSVMCVACRVSCVVCCVSCVMCHVSCVVCRTYLGPRHLGSHPMQHARNGEIDQALAGGHPLREGGLAAQLRGTKGNTERQRE